MYAKAIIHRGAIVIDYVSKEKHLRLSTGITNVTADVFKNGSLTAKFPDHQTKNTIIAVKLKQIDEIIGEYFIKNSCKPSIDFIKETLQTKTKDIVEKEKKYEKFDECFRGFVESAARGKVQPDSLKVHNGTYNALLTYEKYNGKLTLNRINTLEFFQDFQKFLSDPNKNDKTKGIKFRGTKGGLNNNTINKRLSILKAFLRWCQEKKLLTIPSNIFNCKTLIKTFQPTVVVLDKKEQKQIEVLKLSGEEKKMRDVLVFLYKTGMRYSDLLTFCKDDVSVGYIKKYAKKTDKFFEVPLSPKAKQLMEEYDYNFNFFSTVYFNRRIKEILEKYEVCCNNIIIRNQVFATTETSKVKKCTEICSHTGRRTFIADCIKAGFTIPRIMHFTGHTKISSLQAYIDLFGSDANDLKKIRMLDK
jgi:integrase